MRRSLRWGILGLLLTLILAYGGISFLIASGVTKAERKAQESHPQNYGLQFEEVEFPSRRGDVTLRGWFMTGREEGHTLIFVHGIGGTRSSDSTIEIASKLVPLGFNVLVFDLRAHGSSDGDKISGGYFERQDVLGAFDFLVKRGVSAQDIGVVGFSMGAGTAALAAAEEPAIQALVLDSTYADASELIAQETARKTVFPEWMVPLFIPGAEVIANLLYDINIGALAPEKAVKRLDYPILLIHGEADTRIPNGHGVRAYKAAYPGSQLWLVPKTDHVDAFMTHPEEYIQRIADYLDSRLGSPQEAVR